MQLTAVPWVAYTHKQHRQQSGSDDRTTHANGFVSGLEASKSGTDLDAVLPIRRATVENMLLVSGVERGVSSLSPTAGLLAGPTLLGGHIPATWPNARYSATGLSRGAPPQKKMKDMMLALRQQYP